MKRFVPLLLLGILGALAPHADAITRLTVSDASVTEGNSGFKNLSFTVTKYTTGRRPLPGYGVATTAVSVQYATNDISATAGSDYTAKQGTITFASGQTTGQINIAIRGDRIEEADEQLHLTLSGATNAIITNGEAIGTIQDDDYTGQISVSDASVLEGNSGQRDALVRVCLSKPRMYPLQLTYTTQDGTALAGSDYLATSGTLVFSPRETSKIIQVPVVGDTNSEENETLSVVLNASGYSFAKSIGTILIRNDDRYVAPVGKITFRSNRNGNAEIYDMNANGTNQTRLTNNPNADVTPVFSPDGQKITWTTDRDTPGIAQTYVMNANGTNQKRLPSDYHDGSPSFSWDSKTIVFNSNRHGDGDDLYTMNADGTGLKQLTSGVYVDFPAFAPNGHVVFVTIADENNNRRISVVNADGTGVRDLTPATYGVRAGNPHFSPDGNKIVFCLLDSSHDWQIYVMNADGTGKTRITNSDAADLQPVFSPDGTKIAFARFIEDEATVWICNTNGTNAYAVARGCEPSWVKGTVPAPRAVKAAPFPSVSSPSS